jgi:hypothetical protein
MQTANGNLFRMFHRLFLNVTDSTTGILQQLKDRDKHHAESALALMSAHQDNIVGLQQELVHERKKRRRLESKVEELQQQIAEFQSNALVPWTSRNLFYDKITVHRGVHVALRRTLGRTSASNIGMMLGFDIAHTTVAVWEIKACAGLMASAQEWHSVRWHMLQYDGHGGHGDETFGAWCNLYIRCDATSAAVWQQKQKMHGLYVESAIQLRGRAKPETHSLQADLQIIESSDAEALLAVIVKQIRSIGAPVWSDLADCKIPCAYTFCTDAGGDISRTKKLIHSMVAQLPNHVFFMHIDCLMHQYSLATLDLLKIVDQGILRFQRRCQADHEGKGFLYVSTLVKTFNVWREHAAACFFIWKMWILQLPTMLRPCHPNASRQDGA